MICACWGCEETLQAFWPRIYLKLTDFYKSYTKVDVEERSRNGDNSKKSQKIKKLIQLHNKQHKSRRSIVYYAGCFLLHFIASIKNLEIQRQIKDMNVIKDDTMEEFCQQMHSDEMEKTKPIDAEKRLMGQ